MRTLAILPIKDFAAAKQRLGAELSADARRALAQAMFCDVLGVLSQAPAIDGIAVVTANDVPETAMRRTRAVLLDDTEQAGQSAAATVGIRYAQENDFDRVLLVPGDCPLIDADEITDLLDRCDRDAVGVAIVPDRHGSGTNALVLSPPGAIEPSFGVDSLARHIAAARESAAVWRVQEPGSLGLDIDTPEDLAALGERIDVQSGIAPLTNRALRQLDAARPPRLAAVARPAPTARMNV